MLKLFCKCNLDQEARIPQTKVGSCPILEERLSVQCSWFPFVRKWTIMYIQGKPAHDVSKSLRIQTHHLLLYPCILTYCFCQVSLPPFHLLNKEHLLFSLVGFKGNLALPDVFVFFPGDLSKWKLQKPAGKFLRPPVDGNRFEAAAGIGPNAAGVLRPRPRRGWPRPGASLPRAAGQSWGWGGGGGVGGGSKSDLHRV